ncbi:MAG: hypothetical protein ACJ8AS_08975 [Hyphomicrobiales bacterium]
MDWARAIAVNQTALTRIVAALIAMVGLAADGVVARLPRPTYRAMLQVLRPAEAAVRRLIVIAARGLMAKLPPLRPMPAGLALAGRGGGRVSFQLFDARKRFGPARGKSAVVKAEPRIFIHGASPLVPLFRHRALASPVTEPDGTVAALRLGRRLAAIKRALEDLPRQAMRLARWQARRASMEGAKFTSPLRPGPPPGHRKKPKGEIDWVLRTCHALARDALAEDTS